MPKQADQGIVPSEGLWASCRYSFRIISSRSSTSRSQRVGSRASSAYIEEAVRRYAEDIQAEDEIVAEAEAGIADAEAGCFITVSSSGDAEALHERTMARLRDRLASDQG